MLEEKAAKTGHIRTNYVRFFINSSIFISAISVFILISFNCIEAIDTKLTQIIIKMDSNKLLRDSRVFS